jgi:hypothetical protein
MGVCGMSGIMTVGDLIETLLDCPQDAAVFISDGMDEDGLMAQRTEIDGVQTVFWDGQDGEHEIGYVRLNAAA